MWKIRVGVVSIADRQQTIARVQRRQADGGACQTEINGTHEIVSQGNTFKT